MNKVTRRVVWLGFLMLVVAALTAVTALHGTTPTTTFANDSKHHPTPTPLTSIDFLPLSAGVFPRAAFLSFSTFLFLLCFLLVHS